jgi:hypothetical protein
MIPTRFIVKVIEVFRKGKPDDQPIQIDITNTSRDEDRRVTRRPSST